MGMNWVDLSNLKMKNIIDNRIEYSRQKTSRKNAKTFSIGINLKILQILSYYTLGKGPDEYVFNILSDTKNPEIHRNEIKNTLQTFNKYLNKLGKLAGIESRLSSYVSRHSWATAALKMGVDLSIISAGLGHADLPTTQIYLADIDRDDLDKANELITG
jgi:integrase